MNDVANIEGVTSAVQGLLRERLNRYGFERAEVHPGQDHSGDPALFIDAYYRLSEQPLETGLILQSLTDIRKLLINMVEQRFPYVRHHFDEKQRVAGRR